MQMSNNIVHEFLRFLYAFHNNKTQKTNCLMLLGPPSVGKTWFANMGAKLMLNTGFIGNSNRYAQFCSLGFAKEERCTYFFTGLPGGNFRPVMISLDEYIDFKRPAVMALTLLIRLGESPECKGSVPPPPPERTDSLNNRPEDGELKTAPWFQAGIPREITLEVLGQEPVGSFMVRESTSKPGCFALSLRVPHEFQPLGIAHYLILRTNKGYKIKGFTKEFRTLTALITHHSVMPELLPCPLSLSRYNPTYSQQDTRRDFADIDADPDYNTLADFRRMMADLNV